MNSPYEILEIFSKFKVKKFLLVTGKKSFDLCGAKDFFAKKCSEYACRQIVIKTKNLEAEYIEEKIRSLYDFEPDVIIAVGGGKVIDGGKIIKAFLNSKNDISNYVINKSKPDVADIPVIAVPTTVGSGSEETKFAVIYVNGKKCTFEDKKIKPDYILLHSPYCLSLSRYNLVSSCLDAVCQAMESFWSVNSTDESKDFASKALSLLLPNIKGAVKANNESCIANLLNGANLAGKAINISKTTASHAISYNLATQCNIQHGHAVALTIGGVLESNFNVDKKSLNDTRGIDYVKSSINELVNIMGCKNISEVKKLIHKVMESGNLERKLHKLGLTESNLKVIASEVNYERLTNNPKALSHEDILNILRKIY